MDESEGSDVDSYHTFVAEATYRDRVRDRLAEAERERLARRVEASRKITSLLLQLARATLVAVAPGRRGGDQAQCPPPSRVEARAGERPNGRALVGRCDVAPARIGALDDGSLTGGPTPAPASWEPRIAHLRPDGRHLQARYGL